MLSRRLLRIKSIKSLFSHFAGASKTLAGSEKEYNMSIQKCYELYILLLHTIVDVADFAQSRIDIASNKLQPTEQDKNPNLRFVQNRVIEQIRSCEELTDSMIRYRLSWRRDDSIIKELYSDMTQSGYYQRYMAAAESDYRHDSRFVQEFYKTHFEDNELFEAVIEEMSMYWIDDIGFDLGHVVATIVATHQGDDHITLLPMYKNEDDREFAQMLFRTALIKSSEFFGVIESLTKNWDFERIAFMDKIIMLAAIAELTQFPSIPVKVTLDEYIEISKYYSTPSSSVFVNGIIDKAIEKLTAEGKINKTGRGLIDNSDVI